MTSVEYLPQYRKPYSTDYHTTEAPLNGRKLRVYAQARPRLGDGSPWRPLLATGRRTPPKPVLLRFDMQPPQWGYYRYCIVRTSMPVPSASAPTKSGWTGLRQGGGPRGPGICCKGTVKPPFSVRVGTPSRGSTGMEAASFKSGHGTPDGNRGWG